MKTKKTNKKTRVSAKDLLHLPSSVGWSVGQLVGQSVDRPVSWLVGRTSAGPEKEEKNKKTKINNFLWVGRSIGRSVGRSVGSLCFKNCERFSQYGPCPTVRNCLAVYPALFFSDGAKKNSV